MKIGMLTHYFDPEGGAAATPGVLARSLADRGHELRVVTGYPNYPGGKVHEGYSPIRYMSEDLNGMTVHRVPIYPSHDERAGRRMLNFLSYAVSSTLRAPTLFRDVDVQFVYFSPATATTAAIPLAYLKRTPTVLLVQDMWPDSVTTSGFLPPRLNKATEKILTFYCAVLYRAATYVAVTSPGMAGLLAARGVPKEKLVFVPNWSNESAFFRTTRDERSRRELGFEKPFTVMYAGNFGEMQDLDVVLDSAKMLGHRSDIEFVLVGAGVKESHLRERAERDGLTNLRFLPPRPFTEMAKTLALADCQLVTAKDSAIMRTTLPSKLQANMAAGCPVIGVIAGDGAEVIKAAGCGLVSQPGDASQLAEAVETLAGYSQEELSNLSRRAERYYQENFSESVAGDRLEGLLESAAKV